MYKNLKNEMKSRNITVHDIAEVIKTSADEAQRKIDGEEIMLFNEGTAIRERFFPYKKLEYLFEDDG